MHSLLVYGIPALIDGIAGSYRFSADSRRRLGSFERSEASFRVAATQNDVESGRYAFLQIPRCYSFVRSLRRIVVGRSRDERVDFRRDERFHHVLDDFRTFDFDSGRHRFERVVFRFHCSSETLVRVVLERLREDTSNNSHRLFLYQRR